MLRFKYIVLLHTMAWYLNVMYLDVSILYIVAYNNSNNITVKGILHPKMKIVIIYLLSCCLSFVLCCFVLDPIDFHCMDKNYFKYSLKCLFFCSTEYIN